MSRYNIEEEVAYFDLKHKKVINTKVKAIIYCCRVAQDQYYLEDGTRKYEHEIWKPMKQKELKDYLKPGYVIEYDDGLRFVITQDVHGNNFGLQIGASIMWDSLGRLDYIVKVYQIDRPGALHKTFIHDTHLTLVWEKPKEVELTMQQIADKFGVDVNQLKIKK